MSTSNDRVQSTSSSSGGRPPSSSAQNHSSTSHLLTRHQYASDHILQSYEIYLPPSSPPGDSQPQAQGADNDQKIWLIHIHGGAWRDPTITARDSFLPTLSHLLNHAPSSSSSSPASHTTTPNPLIAGYISLNYRLSPHPSYPQPPYPETPSYLLRQAKHPNHISDILTALRFLQTKYHFGGRYILVGHSCGGTLAWQVGMRRNWTAGEGMRGEGKEGFEDVIPPLGIVSVCAIYDLPILVQTHGDVEAYREFTAGAFGEDEGVWEGVSPSRWGSYGESWNSGGEEEEESSGGSVRKEGKRKKGSVAVLAHSRDDELVDWGQLVAMEDTLRKQQQQQQQQQRSKQGNGSAAWRGDIQVLELKGKHNEVWRQGVEMARAIRAALDMLAGGGEPALRLS